MWNCGTNIYSLILTTGTVTTDDDAHSHCSLCLQQCEHSTLFNFCSKLLKPKFHYADFATTHIMKVRNINHVVDFRASCHRLS